MNVSKLSINEAVENICSKYKYNGSILISIKGEVRFKEAYGKANFELDVDNINDSVYRIGSITKQFTAAILWLIERGKIELNDTLDKFIADYPKGDIITIHHLLTHSSGIFNQASIDGFMEKVMRQNHKVQDLIDGFRDQELEFTPGDRYSYSNSGYILLGFIIEQVSGMDFESFLKTNFFTFINMNKSCYDDYKRIIPDRASGYMHDEKTSVLTNCDFIDMSVPYTAGGLLSTTHDLYQWNKALLSGKIISLKNVDLMMTGYSKVSDNEKYGYGLFIKNVEVNGNKTDKVYHGGGIPGFFSSMNHYPEIDTMIILLSNVICDGFWKVESEVEGVILKNRGI